MDDILSKANEYVLAFFKDQLANTFIYHNYNHTLRVVKSTQELIENSSVSEKEKYCLLLAAWFHDTGYAVTYKNHEAESAQIAASFLESNNQPEAVIEAVKQYILATNITVIPKNLPEKIIRDADASHFAKDYFEETSELLRQEFRLHKLHDFTPYEWVEENIKMFVENHRYYTDYAVEYWKPLKDKNLLSLFEKQKKLEKAKIKDKLKAKYKSENPERSIQTLYRTTLRNHIKLSDIADTKANILLSVNAIIISLALANIIPKLDAPSNQHLIIPTLVLICFSVATIILSIMSTRPNVTSGEFTKEQIRNRDVNILFFGNFYKMPFKEYNWAMKEIIKDKDYVYEALTKDLYLLGIVLNRKYKILRWTYTIFMIGIIISVISYLIAIWLM